MVYVVSECLCRSAAGVLFAGLSGPAWCGLPARHVTDTIGIVVLRLHAQRSRRRHSKCIFWLRFRVLAWHATPRLREGVCYAARAVAIGVVSGGADVGAGGGMIHHRSSIDVRSSRGACHLGPPRPCRAGPTGGSSKLPPVLPCRSAPHSRPLHLHVRHVTCIYNCIYSRE